VHKSQATRRRRDYTFCTVAPNNLLVLGMELASRHPSGAQNFELFPIFVEKSWTLDLVKRFPASCRTRRFISMFTRAGHLTLSWVRPVHVTAIHLDALRYYILYIYIYIYTYTYIIFPSTPGSSMWSASLRFLYQNSAYTFLLHHTFRVPHCFPNLFEYRLIFREEYAPWRRLNDVSSF
jgi:hypothetical protein